MRQSKRELSEFSTIQRKRKSPFAIIIHAIIASIVLFLLVSILYEVAQDKLEINRNTENLLELTERGRILQIENAQLESYVSGGEDGGISDEFVERRARDEFGYADPQERVFYAN